jgi:hypothetical protein
LQERSFANQLGDIVGNAEARALDCLCRHTTGYGSGGRSVNCAVKLSAVSFQTFRHD